MRLPMVLSYNESYFDTDTGELVLLYRDTVPNDYWQDPSKYPYITDPMMYFEGKLSAELRCPATVVDNRFPEPEEPEQPLPEVPDVPQPPDPEEPTMATNSP